MADLRLRVGTRCPQGMRTVSSYCCSHELGLAWGDFSQTAKAGMDVEQREVKKNVSAAELDWYLAFLWGAELKVTRNDDGVK
jgi:hypothetical protein